MCTTFGMGTPPEKMNLNSESSLYFNWIAASEKVASTSNTLGIDMKCQLAL